MGMQCKVILRTMLVLNMVGTFGQLGTSFSSENIWKGNNLIYSNVLLIDTFRFIYNALNFFNQISQFLVKPW